jgi:6-pyruvoyltetrahydropterin/6-carboxytetrahydropterin synthase
MAKYQSTKVFDNYSVALRQWKAQHSHCCLLHGYSLEFKVWFESIESDINKQLDEMNWIMDYGGFKSIDATPTPGNGLKDWMNNMWDHTLLIEKDDPQIETFQYLQELGLAKLVIMDKIGAESAAKMVFDKFNDRLSKTGGGRVKVVKVECFENKTNSSIYEDYNYNHPN